MKALKHIMEANVSANKFNFSTNREKFWTISVENPTPYKTRAWINWECPELVQYLVRKYPNCCTVPHTYEYRGIRVSMRYGEDVWGSSFWDIRFYLISKDVKDNQSNDNTALLKIRILLYLGCDWKNPAKVVRQTLEYLSTNLDALDKLFEIANETEFGIHNTNGTLVTLADIKKVKGSKNLLSELNSEDSSNGGIIINKKTFDTIRNEFKKGHYGIVENYLLRIITECGKRNYDQIGVHLGKSEEYRWDHNISSIYIHDNKPNEIHFNVYWQGDSTDGDEVLTFMDYCESKEQQFKFGREYFWLYRDEVLDAINRLEKIVLK